MNCANCGRAMRRDTARDCLVCDLCNTTWFPPLESEGVRVFEQSDSVDCPLCHNRLFEASIEGCPVELCQKCRGILVHGETFLALQASLRLKAGPPV